MSGIGRFDFSDEGYYTGACFDGVAEGLGVYNAPEGRGCYSGSWRSGFEESGVYRWSRENYYEGQWLQGKRHGLGVERLDGWLYKGEWTQGFKGRYGMRQSTKSGAKYEGSWVFGLQDGYGVETYADGGTYQGQWLRGTRHGYGVRQSVSYDLAIRYHQSSTTSPHSSPVGVVPPLTRSTGHDPFLINRNRRLEEGHAGGFVLDGCKTNARRGAGAGGRGPFRFVRQRSSGDIEERGTGTNSRARSVGGSVRSTVSTGHKKTTKDEEKEEEFGSFVSLTDVLFQDEIIERYWGEWKNDRRSGYGICERSDGIKYEGEWIDNKKNGYGVTTLRDGTRMAGKYRMNVILTSTTDTKRFLIRTGRLKEQVENAVKEAEKAAKIAKEKAEIANARTISSRMKADQAQMEAGKAESLAEAAISQARTYSGNVAQQGTQIFMNRLCEDDVLTSVPEPEIALSHPTHAQSKTRQPPLKFLSFLRPKKRQLERKLITDINFDVQMNRNNKTAKFYTTSNRSEPNAQKQPHENSFAQQPTSAMATLRGFDAQRKLHEKQSTIPEGVLTQPEIQRNHEMSQTISFLGQGVANHPNPISTLPISPEISQTLPAFTQFRKLNSPDTGSDSPHYRPPGRRQAHAQIDTEVLTSLPSITPVGSTTDIALGPTMLGRRKSLPSIVKNGAKPEVKQQRIKSPDLETFVIEEGVRKRVTQVYGPKSPVRALAVEGRSGLPKLYRIETAAQGPDRGSVPDVSAGRNMEVLPREAVHALSQQRREELARERERAGKAGGQIVLRLGDMTDWCARRKMFIILLAVNYALATVFYNMLQQQQS